MSLIGKDIKGYHVQQLIGEGGFGAVYTANQRIVDRTVAIKIIWPELSHDPEFIRRFEAEAKIIASLEHPQIVPLYDFWRDPDGAYMVMRWLRGGNLRTRMKRRWQVEEVAHLLNQLASAVTMAHRYGVIHRDIKPENILLDEDDNFYLSDFGIAQSFGARDKDNDIMGMGSVIYAAPEQFNMGNASPQTDQYSLGLLTYELLAGVHPFIDLMSLSHSKLREERRTKLLPLITVVRPDLPQELNAVLARATALSERERYPDALAFVRAFREALAFKAAQRAEASLLNDETLVRTPGGTIRTPDGTRFVDRILEVTPENHSNPYRGLRAFQESDSLYFFGRERLSEHLINRLAETEPPDLCRFLAVVGPSGSGKSSLVKAGVIPALRDNAIPGSDQWYIVNMTPGAHPLDELEVSLLRIATDTNLNIQEQLQRDERGILRVINFILQDGGGEILLCIDQFEELFTLVENPEHTRLFLNSLYAALTAPHTRLRVIVTLRADFYDRPLMYENFSRLMRERTEVVIPMTSEELNRAIITPAKMVGVNFEEGLVTTIASEVSGQLGALPLLQYGLTELFEQREDDVLTLKAYHQMGGILGALARRAETVYASLSQVEQEAARQIFVRLVTLGEGTEDTRRRVLLEEIYAAAKDERVTRKAVETFSASRLLTFDYDPASRSPTLEVAHEAILREWGRLRNWLDESREDIRLQRNLSVLTKEWDKAGRDDSYLLRGIRLEQYELWQKEAGISLTRLESDYLRASVSAREAQRVRQQEQEKQRSVLEQRARFWLRALLVVMFIALLIALGLILRVESENQQVQNARATSDANAALSNTLALVANSRAALAQGNTDLALALAVAANQQSVVPDDAQQLLADVGLGPGTRRIIDAHDSTVGRLVFNNDGTQFISGGTDDIITRWNSIDQTPLQQYTGHTGDVRDVRFNSTETRIASVSDDGEAIIWDVESGEILQRVSIADEPLRAVAFTDDDLHILVGGDNSQLTLIDVQDGSVVDEFTSPVESVYAIHAHNNQAFLIAGSNGGLVLWDMQEERAITQFQGHEGIVRVAIFNDDHSRILSGAEDNHVILWDVNDGSRIQTFQGHSRIVHDVSFGPGEQSMASTSADSTIILWNLNTGEIVERFRATENYAFSLAFVPGEMALLAGYIDGTIRYWELTSVEREWSYRLDERRGLVRVTFAPDGESVFTAIGPTNLNDVIGTRPELIQIDAITGERMRSFPGHLLLISSITISNENTIYTTSFDGSIIERDLTTGEQIRLINPNEGALTALAFSPDQSRVAVASFNEVVLLMDAETGEVIRRFEGHNRPVLSVAYHPDGQWIVSGDDRGTIYLWDVESGEILRTFEGHTAIVFRIVFDADGQRMLTGSIDNQIILWNVETGEPERVFRGHTAGVADVTFSPDEQYILSGAEDGSLLLWSVETGTVVRYLQAHLNAVSGVGFSQDGYFAISSGLDGTMYRWEIGSSLNGDDLLEQVAANRYIPTLSCEEQLVYRLAASCDE